MITFPKGNEEEDRGRKDCCCEEAVLASSTSTDVLKNDVKGVHIKKSDPSDIVTFTIEKCGGPVLANLGVVSVFPNEPNGVGFEYDWKQYLIAHGAGKYIIKVQFTISGVIGDYTHGTYTLKEYSVTSAKHTVRIRSVFNSYLLKEEFDFTGSGFTDTVRFNGFFGTRKPNTKMNNLIDTGRTIAKSTRENINLYELNTDPLLECITKQIIDFHLLCEDGCFISDHNNHNHSYNEYEDKPVSLDNDNGGIETEPIKLSRFIYINAIFGDRKQIDKSYYNG